jgi:hypothetical protein
MHLGYLGPLTFALLLSAIFFFGSRVPMPREGDRYYRRAISISAGVSVAYVFLELLPELSSAREVLLGASKGQALFFEKYRVYLGALTGFTFFYGVHHLQALVSRERVAAGLWQARNWPFLLYVSVFFLYVWLVTYFRGNSLEEIEGSAVFYSLAMGFHLFLIDYSLRREYGMLYRKKVKNALAAAPLLGWLVGMYVVLPVTVIIPMMGFVAGGIIMNTMVLEIPRESENRFLYFSLGVVLYSAAILIFI